MYAISRISTFSTISRISLIELLVVVCRQEEPDEPTGEREAGGHSQEGPHATLRVRA